jgi:hypothetical protein
MLNHYGMSTGSRAVREIMNGDFISNNLIRSSYQHHLANAEEAQQANYTEYREYYDGIHSAQLTARLKAFLQLQNDKEFSLNLCRIVVDALAELLKVTGFEAGDTQGDLFWQWWDDNDMDGEQGRVHLAAIRDGDTYVLVEWDNIENRPSFTHELACAGGEGVKVHYSPENRKKVEFASKRWKVGTDGKQRRLNLYFDNHIEKYIGSDSELEGNWRPYLDGTEAKGVTPMGVYGACGWHWWTDDRTADGRPLGVPVVHFKNKDQGYNRGESELSDAIAVQNALNKAFIDLLASNDAAALRILVGIGGGWGGLQIFPGVLATNDNPDASLTAIEGEDPNKQISVVDNIKATMGQVTRTPISYFQISGHRPAADTLKQEESGLIGKAEKCQVDFGNRWEQVFKIARRLHNAFAVSAPKLDETQRVECQWKDPQKRNEKELLETLEAKARLGVPQEQIWQEMGYNAGQIIEFKRLKLQAQALAIRQQAKQENANVTQPAEQSGRPAELRPAA